MQISDAMDREADIAENFDEFEADFEDTTIHCWKGGSGRPVILMHGSGAGASTLSNFRRVLVPLARRHLVLAADLVGFGQSGLRPRPPFFDMSMWVRELDQLIEMAGSDQCIVIGHSLSGPIALKCAAHNPSIAGVVTTGTMGTPASTARSKSQRWTYPENDEQIRVAVERTLFDKSLATDSEVARRRRVLQRPGYRSYFGRMFDGPAEAHVNESAVTDDEVARVTCPVVLLHGIADASWAPEETSLALARRLRDADVQVLARCAHSVALERPDAVMTAVKRLDGALDHISTP